MTKRNPAVQYRIIDWLLGALLAIVLGGCILYAYAAVFWVPYSGIVFTSKWEVEYIEPCENYQAWCEANQGRLKSGDQLLSIGELEYHSYRQNNLITPFSHYQAGSTVPLRVIRDDTIIDVVWTMPDIAFANILPRLSILIICLPFWFAGAVVFFSARPRNEQQRVLVFFTNLTAVWLAAGSLSTFHIAASSPVLHLTTWLLVPAYIHLHLIVPTRLLQQKYLSNGLWLYLVGIALALLESFGMLNSQAYLLGFALGIIISLILMLVQWLRNRGDQGVRLSIRLMVMGIVFAFGPGVVFWILPLLLSSEASVIAPVVIAINLPIWPFLYTYAIIKHHLGALELRANRLLSGYLFSILYLSFFGMVYLLVEKFSSSSFDFVLLIFLSSLLFIVFAAPLRRQFEGFVEKLFYGTKINTKEVVRAFANLAPLVTDRQHLISILADDLLPSLLIRQSAIYLTASPPTLFYAQGIHAENTPEMIQDVPALESALLSYIPSDSTIESKVLDWVRLVVPVKHQNQTKGYWLFGERDPDDYYPAKDIDLLQTLANQTAVAIENLKLFEDVQKSNQRLKEAYDVTLEGWARALDLRDGETQGHSSRVAELTVQLGEAMGIPAEALVQLRRGALLHDIGKMGIPDKILLKPGSLNDEEWAVMRKHPEYAYEMLAPIKFLGPALEIPYFHHEKWDGSGYPCGMKGTEIPLSARIFAVIDVWDALCSVRPYRAAWTKQVVIDYIASQSGVHFDPEVVAHFVHLLESGDMAGA